MPKLVFDSSALISLSERCMAKLIEKIADKKGAEVVIPMSVYQESVLTPLRKKRFEFNAVRIDDLVERGKIRIAKDKFKGKTKYILDLANSMFTTSKGNLKIIHLGEAEALALILEEGADVFVIDERTTREIIENPESVLNYLKRRHRTSIKMNKDVVDEFLSMFNKLKVVRSAEIVAYSYSDGLFEGMLPQRKQALEAALFAIKFAGCSVAIEEIKTYLKSVRNKT